jgi:3,4-dihydroxy 2-butanone 4-phosphate synthase/GTP cyclohydrolase II
MRIARDSAGAGDSAGDGAGDRARVSVTLSWAQSLDGSIAARRGVRTRISGEASLAITHRLRAEHDAILVGVGTVLADDPRLDVRHAVGTKGTVLGVGTVGTVLTDGPQPVVLDAGLRTPLESALVRRTDKKPWIFAAAGAHGGTSERRAALEAAGCRIMSAGVDASGRLDLAEVLAGLASSGIASLMVEGGGAVLAAFLEARLVDRIVVTIGSRLMGGYNPFAQSPLGTLPVDLDDPRIFILGSDVVIDGVPRWPPDSL